MIKKIARKVKNFYFQKQKFPAVISQELLIQQSANFFSIPVGDVQIRYQAYRQFHIDQQYELRFGERKTLCFEEAFLLYLAVLQIQTNNIVEIGTQHGKSTRRILDILHFAGIENCKLTCFDITDQVKYFSRDEACLELHDLTYDFKEHVLLNLKPDLIFLDAHPYWLLYNVISEYLNWSKSNPSIIAIHDCSPMLYNPRMRIKKNDLAVTSQTGVWERHVLCEVFHTSNQFLDDLQLSGHQLRIFHTPHGLAMIQTKKS